MNFWGTLLTWLGMREQARAAGASAKDANKAAGLGVALDEIAKKAAEQEQDKK